MTKGLVEKFVDDIATELDELLFQDVCRQAALGQMGFGLTSTDYGSADLTKA